MVMTNVSSTAEKLSLRSFLLQVAEEALVKGGWKVERIARSGKASVRRITRGQEQKRVSIRTSQDTWIAFPRTSDDAAWATLADVDFVVAASVDDRLDPQFAQVHLVPGDDLRHRFDRAYAARKKAGYSLPIGRGIWLSLYEEESANPVTLVGGGIGLAYPPIAKLPLPGQGLGGQDAESKPAHSVAPDAPLTIAEAKRGLARSFGVPEDAVEITIRG
jgi:hypothetical protein